MPALIVFAAGIAVTASLTVLGPAVGSALGIGVIIGAVLRPFVVGAIQNW